MELNADYKFVATSEEEDDTQKIISEEEEQQRQLVDENESSTDYQGDEDELEEEKSPNIALDECTKEGKSKNSLAKDIKKLKQHFPIWNTKEIGKEKNVYLSYEF